MKQPLPLTLIEETLKGRREPQTRRGALYVPPVDTWKGVGEDQVMIPPAVRPAAVIMGFLERAESSGASLVFTKRSSSVRFHKGEISFPGGEFDTNIDRSLQETAVREIEEEIGVAREHVQVLGQLAGVGVTSGYWVVPYPAIIGPSTPFIVNLREVERVLEVPVHELLDPQIHTMQQWEKDDRKFPIHIFKWRNETIWGATGNLVWHLIQLLQET